LGYIRVVDSNFGEKNTKIKCRGEIRKIREWGTVPAFKTRETSRVQGREEWRRREDDQMVSREWGRTCRNK
jgi:hypothetical protein